MSPIVSNALGLLATAGLIGGIVASGGPLVPLKITPPTQFCETGSGNQPPGQQPTCQGGGLDQEQTPATNPSGKAPPGQN